MQNYDVTKSKVDWFSINLGEFERLFVEAQEASDEYDRLTARADACESRACGHPPFKKDGTPDKRRYCNHPDAMDYSRATDKLNSLGYKYGELWRFFKAIGLLSNGNESAEDGA